MSNYFGNSKFWLGLQDDYDIEFEKPKELELKTSSLLMIKKSSLMFNLFHLSLKLSGFPIAKAQADFEKILQISKQIILIISKLKSEIVEFHLKNNTFIKI